MESRIKGKVALITGATSGIGRSCARELAKLGCNVIVTGRRAGMLEAVKMEVEALGAKVFYAAVSQEEDGIHLSGSRALGIVAQGETIAEAEKIAEEACKIIKGNVYHRRDVGTEALIQKRIDHMEAIRNE